MGPSESRACWRQGRHDGTATPGAGKPSPPACGTGQQRPSPGWRRRWAGRAKKRPQPEGHGPKGRGLLIHQWRPKPTRQAGRRPELDQEPLHRASVGEHGEETGTGDARAGLLISRAKPQGSETVQNSPGLEIQFCTDLSLRVKPRDNPLNSRSDSRTGYHEGIVPRFYPTGCSRPRRQE